MCGVNVCISSELFLVSCSPSPGLAGIDTPESLPPVSPREQRLELEPGLVPGACRPSHSQLCSIPPGLGFRDSQIIVSNQNASQSWVAMCEPCLGCRWRPALALLEKLLRSRPRSAVVIKVNSRALFFRMSEYFLFQSILNAFQQCFLFPFVLSVNLETLLHFVYVLCRPGENIFIAGRPCRPTA